MEHEEHREKVAEYFSSNGPDDEVLGLDVKGLDDALYSMNELGLWPDYVDSVSAEQAMPY